ncbi:secondary carrier transporter [Lithospermum erythrorhizon]|uniref:Secondary carrier transporter n=1 Tax=Lithospermum erythrorhizon TaxID=34254 RepID=A0AAV3QVW7_LITER
MIHMAFCSSLAFILVRILKLVEPISLSIHVYLTSVVQIGALYSLSLWLSNSAYIYLSISFIQMLKALMPVAVYTISIGLKKESFKKNIMSNMVAISIGVAIVAFGEAKYDSWGVLLQLGALDLVFMLTSLNSSTWSTHSWVLENKFMGLIDFLATIIKTIKSELT